jgi:hypothetical protein
MFCHYGSEYLMLELVWIDRQTVLTSDDQVVRAPFVRSRTFTHLMLSRLP